MAIYITYRLKQRIVGRGEKSCKFVRVFGHIYSKSKMYKANRVTDQGTQVKPTTAFAKGAKYNACAPMNCSYIWEIFIYMRLLLCPQGLPVKALKL